MNETILSTDISKFGDSLTFHCQLQDQTLHGAVNRMEVGHQYQVFSYILSQTGQECRLPQNWQELANFKTVKAAIDSVLSNYNLSTSFNMPEMPVILKAEAEAKFVNLFRRQGLAMTEEVKTKAKNIVDTPQIYSDSYVISGECFDLGLYNIDVNKALQLFS